MGKVRTSTNIKSAFEQMDRFVLAVNIPRALNTTLDQTKLAGLRKIRDIYDLSTGDLAPYFDSTLATEADARARIVAKGQGLPLRLFKPTQDKKVGGGVYVTVKRRRFLVPHGFIANLPGAGPQVVARGRYGSGNAVAAPSSGVTKRRKGGLAPRGFQPTGQAFGRLEFGRLRLPIQLLRSMSPPDMLSNDDVNEAMNERTREQMSKNLQREFRAALRGFGS